MITTRRQFIRGAVAVGVAAALPGPMADATSLPYSALRTQYVNGFNYVGPGSVGPSTVWEGGADWIKLLRISQYTEAERIAARVTSVLEYKFTKFFDSDID